MQKLMLTLMAGIFPVMSALANGSGLPDVWQNETARIRSVVYDNSKSVYFIRVFGGLIPLPDRYVLTVTSGPVLEFNSRLEVSLVPEPTGYIRAGMYQDYLDIYASQFDNRKTTDVDSRGGELEITLFHPPEGVPALARINTILIHDAKQFLLISDQNPELWKAMLEVYERLNK